MSDKKRGKNYELIKKLEYTSEYSIGRDRFFRIMQSHNLALSAKRDNAINSRRKYPLSPF